MVTPILGIARTQTEKSGGCVLLIGFRLFARSTQPNQKKGKMRKLAILVFVGLLNVVEGILSWGILAGVFGRLVFAIGFLILSLSLSCLILTIRL